MRKCVSASLGANAGLCLALVDEAKRSVVACWELAGLALAWHLAGGAFNWQRSRAKFHGIAPGGGNKPRSFRFSHFCHVPKPAPAGPRAHVESRHLLSKATRHQLAALLRIYLIPSTQNRTEDRTEPTSSRDFFCSCPQVRLHRRRSPPLQRHRHPARFVRVRTVCLALCSSAS